MILIGLGSNLTTQAGGPSETLDAALTALEDMGARPARRSAYYTSAPIGPPDQPWFVNAVAELDSPLDPEALLQALHALEARFARRREMRWQARTLDLDLLDWHGTIRPDYTDWKAAAASSQAPARLILPHPQLHRRRFVLDPLTEIAPDWRHPVFGCAAGALLESVRDQAVNRLETGTRS